MTKTVLVTGATGFVGANLTRHLLRDGHSVHCLVRSGYKSWRVEEIQADVRLHEVDMLDGARLTATVQSIRPDWVFHLAAHGAYSWQTDVHRIVQTNFLSTINLVQAALATGFEAFVNTGSSSEYGFKDHAPAETEWLEPNSHYAVAKAAATQFCRYTAQSQNVKLPTLRLYSVYGPYEDPGRLIPTLIGHGRRGQWPPLVNPDTARDYVYVDDVCDAYLAAATRPLPEPGAVYNIGSGRQTPLREVVDAVRHIMHIEAEPQWGTMPGRVWDTSVWVADNRRAVAELGWEPRQVLHHGLESTLQWFESAPAPIASHYEPGASRS